MKGLAYLERECLGPVEAPTMIECFYIAEAIGGDCFMWSHDIEDFVWGFHDCARGMRVVACTLHGTGCAMRSFWKCEPHCRPYWVPTKNRSAA